MEDAKAMLEKAARYRLHARTLTDKKAVTALLYLASELEGKAAKIDSEPSPEPTARL